MKIFNFAVLGLSLLGSVEGSPGAVVPNLAEAVSESSSASNLQRELAVYTIIYEDDCNNLEPPYRCCDFTNNGNCVQQNNGIDNTFTVPIGSCGDQGACSAVGDLTLGGYSCIGNSACYYAGQMHNSLIGSASVASNSCKGANSCMEIGQGGGDATIGSNSCHSIIMDAGNQNTCRNTAMGGHAVIGDHSCYGNEACRSFGQDLPDDSHANMGSHSCYGDYACRAVTSGPRSGGIDIGDGSCNGVGACREISYNQPHRIVIGSRSCNCADCCRCLIKMRRGAGIDIVVPDDSCNTVEEGADRCCKGENGLDLSLNDIFVADASTATVPSAPGSSTTTASLTTTAASNAVAPPEYGLDFGNCTFTPSDSGSPDVGSIACGFTASGGVNHTVSSEILAGDCAPDTVAPIGVVQDSSTTFVPTFEDGSTTQQNSTYDVTISLANSAVESGENITFCLMTNVFDATGDSYTFSGQKIELLISTDGGFSSEGLTTKTFDGITSSAESAGTAAFTVTAYRCDINGNRETADTELSLGENFFLCVEGSQSSVRITSIGSLTATKPETGFVPINLIVAGAVGVEGIANTNTFVYGKNSNKAVIATRLPSRFFASDEGITLTGSANIDNAEVRRLARLMQETSTLEESSDFSMDIPIVASPMFKTAGGSTKGPVGVFLLAVAAAVALFV